MRKLFYSLSLAIAFFAMPLLVQAATPGPVDAFKSVVTESTLTEDADSIPNAQLVIGQIIRSVLLYVGVLVLALIVYAGFLWATARGNEAQIKKAKQILIGSVIGLLIIFSAGAIVDFVLTNVLIEAVSL